MDDWHTFVIPAMSALFAFIGAIIGNKTDIAWIKRELARHDVELLRLHSRISKAFHHKGD